MSTTDWYNHDLWVATRKALKEAKCFKSFMTLQLMLDSLEAERLRQLSEYYEHGNGD